MNGFGYHGKSKDDQAYVLFTLDSSEAKPVKPLKLILSAQNRCVNLKIVVTRCGSSSVLIRLAWALFSPQDSKYVEQNNSSWEFMSHCLMVSAPDFEIGLLFPH